MSLQVYKALYDSQTFCTYFEEIRGVYEKL